MVDLPKNDNIGMKILASALCDGRKKNSLLGIGQIPDD
jgi:hypothetical protein